MLVRTLKEGMWKHASLILCLYVNYRMNLNSQTDSQENWKKQISQIYNELMSSLSFQHGTCTMPEPFDQ